MLFVSIIILKSHFRNNEYTLRIKVTRLKVDINIM